MENWKEIEGTSGRYLISDCGRIKSTKHRGSSRSAILEPGPLPSTGYKTVVITFDGNSKKARVFIHRLVAEYFCFIPESSEKMEVNHIDGNKLNNNSSNLEWVTSSGNTEHAISTGALVPWGKPRRPVRAICTTTGKTMDFVSISKAEIHFGSRHIDQVLSGKRKTTKGHTFEYIHARG